MSNSKPDGVDLRLVPAKVGGKTIEEVLHRINEVGDALLKLQFEAISLHETDTKLSKARRSLHGVQASLHRAHELLVDKERNDE